MRWIKARTRRILERVTSVTEQPTSRRTAPTSTPTQLVPVLFVIGSIVSLQFGSGYATTLFDEAGAMGVTAMRLGFAALIMMAVVRPRMRGWDRSQWKTVVAFGLSLALMNGFFYAAIAQIPFGIALAFEFLGPLGLAAALSRRARDFAWVLLALAGVTTIGLHNADTGALNVSGVVFALLAAASWAGYIVLGARTAKAVPGHQGLAAGLVVAAIVLVPLGFVSAGSALLSPSVLVPGIAVAVLSSVMPYAMEMQALKTMPKKTFSILLALEPAAGVLTGVIMLGQHLDLLTIAAIGLVVIAGMGATVASADQPRRRFGRRRTNPGDAVLT